MTYFCQGKVSKWMVVTKFIVFKEFVMTLLASTLVFHKNNSISFRVLSYLTFFL